MICFEVVLNSRRLCLAGIGEYGLLSQYLSWDYIAPAERLPNRQDYHPHLTLIVNGRAGTGAAELSCWIEDDVAISVGDELTVRIVEAGAPDPPRRVSVSAQRQEAREARRRLFEELKKEFGADDAAA